MNKKKKYKGYVDSNAIFISDSTAKQITMYHEEIHAEPTKRIIKQLNRELVKRINQKIFRSMGN